MFSVKRERKVGISCVLNEEREARDRYAGRRDVQYIYNTHDKHLSWVIYHLKVRYHAHLIPGVSPLSFFIFYLTGHLRRTLRWNEGTRVWTPGRHRKGVAFRMPRTVPSLCAIGQWQRRGKSTVKSLTERWVNRNTWDSENSPGSSHSFLSALMAA